MSKYIDLILVNHKILTYFIIFINVEDGQLQVIFYS